MTTPRRRTRAPLLAPAYAALLLGLLATGVPAQVSRAGGFDVYRSRALDTALLHQRHGPLLDSVRAAVAGGDMDALGTSVRALGASLRNAHAFAFLDLAAIQYPEGDTTVWYFTVDVVDSADVARLRFADAPTGQVEGLDSLLAAWRRFEEDGFARRAFWSEDEPCPAYHCLFSFQDSALAGYAEMFARGADEHADLLERMIHDDADPEDRGHAAFLFAHHHDRDRVARVLVERLDDPSSFVRNNAARVLALMARGDHADAVPTEPFLTLIDGPATTDRNKALAVLDGLARDPENHDPIRRRAGRRLLELLELTQPNNHDFAWSILKRISGEEYGARDYAAWARWLAAAAEGDGALPDEPRGTLLVAGMDGDAVWVLDAATGRRRAEIATHVPPHEVAVSSDGREAAVANYGNQQRGPGNLIQILDVSTGVVVRELVVEGEERLHGLAHLPGDSLLAATSERTGEILVLGVEDGRVRRRLSTGGRVPHMLALGGDWMYAANLLDGTVARVDPRGAVETRTWPAGTRTEGIAATPDGTEGWTGSMETGDVVGIEGATGRVVARVAGLAVPYRLAVTPDGATVVVSDPQAQELILVDRGRGAIRARVDIGAAAAEAGLGSEPSPQGFTLSTDGRWAFVSAKAIDRVAVVDLAAARVVRFLEAPRGPDGIAYSPH